MLAIAAGANNPARWRSARAAPSSFLQGINLVTAATNSGNAPEYYGLAILAYVAANRTDLLSNAGSGQIDLVAKLESYQSLTNGYYSPTLGNRRQPPRRPPGPSSASSPLTRAARPR